MLEFLPIESQGLTDAFHRSGVNMRLLGLLDVDHFLGMLCN